MSGAATSASLGSAVGQNHAQVGFLIDLFGLETGRFFRWPNYSECDHVKTYLSEAWIYTWLLAQAIFMISASSCRDEAVVPADNPHDILQGISFAGG